MIGTSSCLFLECIPKRVHTSRTSMKYVWQAAHSPWGFKAVSHNARDARTQLSYIHKICCVHRLVSFVSGCVISMTHTPNARTLHSQFNFAWPVSTRMTRVCDGTATRNAHCARNLIVRVYMLAIEYKLRRLPPNPNWNRIPGTTTHQWKFASSNTHTRVA